MKTVLFTTPKLLWGGVTLFIDLIVSPSFELLGFVLGAIALDFVTGVTKAKFKKEARTSDGYRKTIVKVMQYIIPVVIIWVASFRVPHYQSALQQVAGWVMLFIIYIEVTSTFENLYEIDKKSVIAKYLYRPALKILKFGITHNPVVDAAKKIDEQTEEKKEEPKP